MNAITTPPRTVRITFAECPICGGRHELPIPVSWDDTVEAVMNLLADECPEVP